MRRLAHLLLFLGIMSAQALASPLQDDLRNALVGKIFILHGLYSGSHLKYDSDGQVQGKQTHGIWTTNGYFRVNSVELKKESLSIKATRLAVTFKRQPRDEKQPWCTPQPTPEMQFWNGDNLEISIATAPSPSAVQIVSAFQKIVLQKSADLSAEVPPLWTNFLRRLRMTPEEAEKEKKDKLAECNLREVERKEDVKPAASIAELKVERTLSDGEQVYNISEKRGVKASKVVVAPDPDYSEAARRAGFECRATFLTIVDRTGHLRDTEVTEPCGLGLDEAGDQTLRQWSFRPATFKGDPVAVQINVEINFRLTR